MPTILAAEATLDVPVWFWGAFIGVVVLLLTLDLALFHRKPHEVRTREAVGWAAFWIGLSLAFNAWVWWEFGAKHGLDFFTGYVVEESLSVDNLFVFLLLFTYFKVPPPLQHRVLFFGILGAIVFRMAFVWAGAELLERFHWVNWIFGAFLVFTAAKLLFQRDAEPDPSKNAVLRLVKRFVPFTDAYDGARLTTMKDGRRVATMLLVVIFVVEATDIAFAVDSVPAVFGVTHEPFIVFTSNICAILGLRSIYFLLARFMGAFRFLKPGLALVLGFVGVKMFGLFEIGSGLSLGIIGGILTLATVASIVAPKKKD
jgi:tellurite resistance protein TerC